MKNKTFKQIPCNMKRDSIKKTLDHPIKYYVYNEFKIKFRSEFKKVLIKSSNKKIENYNY